jgi:hypothetical protein
MSWYQNEEERLAFATGGYSFVLFDPANASLTIADINNIYAQNELTFETLKIALRECRYANKGLCFAVAMLTLTGVDNLKLKEALKSFSKRTFAQYCSN